MILAGDVGGTKVHLALYTFEDNRLKKLRDQKFPAHDFAQLDDVVHLFLAEAEGRPKQDPAEISAACFGCPGPVRDGRLKLTNLPWTLDARDLRKSLGIEHIFLINDLEANGYGVPELALRADPHAACRRRNSRRPSRPDRRRHRPRRSSADL